MHTCRAVDRFKAIAARVRRSPFLSGVLPPLLLLTSSSEANGRYALPPLFYRCDNGETLVSQVEYEDQLGTGKLLAVYPYSIEERQQVLWITKGRQYISVGDQQYDCNLWGRGDDGDAGVWGIPNPSALKEYAKRFTPRSRYTCEGEHTVVFRITDFVDAGHHHGVMKVNDQEDVGLYWTRGTSGNFNGKASREPGIAFAWGVHTGDDNKPVIRYFLNIDDQSFTCIQGRY